MDCLARGTAIFAFGLHGWFGVSATPPMRSCVYVCDCLVLLNRRLLSPVREPHEGNFAKLRRSVINYFYTVDCIADFNYVTAG